VHRVVLEAALDVAWARTSLEHPRVKDVKTFKRFTTGSHRVRRAMRSLGVEERIIKEGRPGLNPVEALADRMVEARTSPVGQPVPPPPNRPFLMANLGSGRNAFEDLARLMGGPRSKDAAKITMDVFSVDDNPAFGATVSGDLTKWRSWLGPALRKFMRERGLPEMTARFDYVHFSPTCSPFSILKQTGVSGERHLEEGVWLVLLGMALVLELNPRVYTLESSWRGKQTLRTLPLMEPLASAMHRLSLCSFHPCDFHKFGTWWTNVPAQVWKERMPKECDERNLCIHKLWTFHHRRVMDKGQGPEAAAFPETLCRLLVEVAMATIRWHLVGDD